MSLTKRTNLLSAESSDLFNIPVARRPLLHENLGYLVLDRSSPSSATSVQFVQSRPPLLHGPDPNLVKRLVKQNRADTERIAILEDEVADLREMVNLLVQQDEELQPRTIKKAVAKKEIKQFFEDHHGMALYPSDVAEALNLDYELVSELMDLLEESGELEGA